ncbi:MAG: hypothetical protein HYV02_02495 [Deltaproteobacteria bacterium]|nr:hypothetical protein [Deltaproteobacteria bacterium]
MAIDHIHRGPDATMRPHLNDPQIVEALKFGDIHKILQALPSGISKADLEEYLKQEWVVFDQGLLQNLQIKADAGSMPPPDLVKHVLPIDDAHTLMPEEHHLLTEFFGVGQAAVMASGASAKGADLPEGGAPVAPPTDADLAQQDAEQFGQSLLETIGDRMEERDEFLHHIENEIFNTQLTNELLAKRDEIRREFRRIIDLMRRGLVQPEFVLVALTKVQVMESGVLVSTEGRKLMHLSEEQSRIAESIQSLDPSSVGDFEMKKQQMAEQSLSMNMIMQNIQRAAQNMDTALSRGKSMLEEYNRTKLEVIRRVAVQG